MIDGLLRTYTVEDLLWFIPVALFAMAMLQLLFVLWLRYVPTDSGEIRQPNEPIMPRVPYSNVPSGASGRSVGGDVQMGSMGKMVVLQGAKRQEIQLPAQQFTIGRYRNEEQSVLLALDDRSVSRRHALFSGDDALREYYLMDVDSSYGTYIQIENVYERLTPNRKERLYNEDTVKFGNDVIVRFVLPCDTRGSSTRI